MHQYICLQEKMQVSKGEVKVINHHDHELRPITTHMLYLVAHSGQQLVHRLC